MAEWLPLVAGTRFNAAVHALRLTATSGRIRVLAEARDGLLVERGEDRADADGREIRGGSDGVRVRVPTGTDLVIGSDSGSVTAEGVLGAVGITTTSGRVRIDHCRELDVRTGSGRLDVGEVDGDARIRSTTGRIQVQRVGGALRVDSTSGRVEVDDVHGAVTARTVEGRLTIGLQGTEPVCCESVSGRIDVTVPRGVAPSTSMRTVSGRCTCDLPEGTAPAISARTVSGRIDVRARDAHG